MKQKKQLRAVVAVTALNACLFLPQAQAANKTWSGAGSDANWSTGANWGGTAPANNDNLIFSDTTQQNNTNNISNLTLGFANFNNGGFVLNGNLLTLNGSTTAFFTNSAGTNIISSPLITGAPGGRYWFISPNSELRLTAALTNNVATGASVGWLNLTNGGTVRIMNSAKSTRGMDLFQGTVIVDGSSALVDAANDGFRFKPPTGSTAAVQLTNNGTIRIGTGGNFRMGHNGNGIGGIAGAGSISRMDMSSGTLELYGPAVNVLVGDLVAGATGIFNQNGGLVWGSGGSGNAVTIGNSVNADGTYNLNGGVLWIAKVQQGNPGATNVVFNFNGGTLKPTASSTTFMQGLLTAKILSGGAFIDTTNLNITIGQSLAGIGNLTKLGTGTLMLTGASSYSGSTVVSNGTLSLGTDWINGGGGLVVADGATLSLTNTGSTLSVSSLNMGSVGASTLQLNFTNGNPVSASIVAGTLTGHGSVFVNIAGTGLTAGAFPLVNFTSGSGLASFHLGYVPPGVSASLVTTPTSIQLNISSVGKSLAWTGAANNQWDTSSINWYDLGNGNNPATYSQSGGFGDMVTFDDTLTGSPAINLTFAVVPVTMSFNNNGAAYSFTGAGKISGVGSLTKNGFQALTLGTVNDYAGGTFLNSGSIYLGANQALGTGAATLNLGTLASDSTTARTLPNTLIQNADTGIILGDTANTGTLTLAGGLNLGGGATRTLNFNSDVVVTGSLTNGGISTKAGSGTLTIKGNSAQTGLVAQQQGDVIVDGAQFTNADGWRLQNTFPGSTMRLVVTNGGVLNVAVAGNTGNLRVGLAGGDNSADNILDISGTVDLTPSIAVAGNNAVNLGASGVNDILYLRSGGLLKTRAVLGSAPANAEVHFMGGTLTAIVNDTGFIQGLTNTFMDNGGLTVDTSNFTVTVPQPLLAAGNGGLIKVGTGALTLTGASTYTGPTVVNAGKLVLGPAFISPSAITVNANSTLAFLQSSSTNIVQVSSVLVGGGTNSALEAELAATNAPAGYMTNLILNGSVVVNVTGPATVGRFPLFGYGTISGAGNLTIGQLPLGTVATIATNTTAHTVDLVVSGFASEIWIGNINANWDTITTNWVLSGVPLAFSQAANVVLNDSASNSVVNLATTLSPSSVGVSNSALSYQFSGPGNLSGSMTLTKEGTNSLTISSTNSFVGRVSINAGTVVLGSATGLGATANSVYITNSGALDVGGNNLGLQPIIASGSGVNGSGAIVNSGAAQNDALRNLTLAGDTTVSAAIGLRTIADSDPGLVGNGHKLIKVGPSQFNINGGTTVAGLTNVWTTDLGDVDIRQGILSFERRTALGRTNNTITIEAGATLLLFSLNQTLSQPVNKIVMTNAILQGSGATAGDVNALAGLITLNGSTNAINSTAGTVLSLNGPITGTGGATYDGSVTLAGANTYTGPTIVSGGTLTLASGALLGGTTSIIASSNGTLDISAVSPLTLGAGQTLGGSGVVNGSVVANGPVAPGDSIGTLTINGDLTLAGNLLIEVNRSLPQPNDSITVSGILNNTGAHSVVVTNLGTALVAGDKFTLFNQPIPNGGALTVTGGNATWTNNLAVDGSISVLSVGSPVNPNPTPITFSYAGGNINLSWPADHTGWHLQVQTNSLTTGLSTNWFTVPGSTTTNAMSIPVSAGNPCVFFRLVYP
ncbi:beta strand repeat-containing protein [Pedosphaera parvula]|uniref:Autotransporter-associated beta strand repeat protein n=1 Tax=Pedosphaera parvula (strain Ellin514) TaxID=320771 RepID=B9XA54_PEDPL|nr:autotransporter-associated beta strand repeat-containing protein [Pedosphaera parvula]EEF63395.1 autotransporter-associated beta strand repeat protein [Pedosphaera parvula Ellin514]